MTESLLILAAKESMKIGRWADAERDALEELGQQPDSLIALRLAGEAAVLQGKGAEAVVLAEKILELEPNDLAALGFLASIFWQSQRIDEAAYCCERFLEIQPANASIRNMLGLCQFTRAEFDEAISNFGEAARLDPTVAIYPQNLAQSLERKGRWGEAAEAYRQALALDPNAAQCLSGLALICVGMGLSSEAGDLLDRLAAIRPLTDTEQLLYGEMLLLSCRADEALACANTILEADPAQTGAFILRANILLQTGKHAEAIVDLKKAIEIDPSAATPYWRLSQCRRIDESDRPLIEQMEALAKTRDCPPLERGVIHFALGKASNDLRQFELAMAHYDEANRLFKATKQEAFDPSQMEQTVSGLIATFTREFIESHSNLGLETELPIFIVGMARSGTTLVESVLASHPLVRAGGELTFWPAEAPRVVRADSRDIDERLSAELASRYISELGTIGPGAMRVTDKQPSNILYVGLLHLLFPRARIVHCKRHPVDTCLSIYMNQMKGAAFLHDKANIVVAYREYERLMTHWRVTLPSEAFYEIQYEELVSEPEAVSRRLVEFCGLDWDESCLHPERSERLITTASHWQARQPVYKGSVERWRDYEPWLGEFKGLL